MSGLDDLPRPPDVEECFYAYLDSSLDLQWDSGGVVESAVSVIVFSVLAALCCMCACIVQCIKCKRDRREREGMEVEQEEEAEEVAMEEGLSKPTASPEEEHATLPKDLNFDTISLRTTTTPPEHEEEGNKLPWEETPNLRAHTLPPLLEGGGQEDVPNNPPPAYREVFVQSVTSPVAQWSKAEVQ